MDEKVVGSFRAIAEEAERLHEIGEHPYRDKFQRDRDRILYSKEFRRLSGKTQVFVAGSDDNMRTRLTHTLEVAQIAETMANRLGLDSMLTRAIALGHDIGHTPFGHVGERTLNSIMNGCYPYWRYNEILSDKEKGFKHNLQGVRVACCLEKSLDADNKLVNGLNLTRYTLWGIQNHSSLTYKPCVYCDRERECRLRNRGKACNGTLSVAYYTTLPYKADDRKDWTFEGVIVAYADEIAQRHHDIEDGIYAGIIRMDHLCDFISSKAAFNGPLADAINTYKKDATLTDTNRLEVGIRILSRAIVDYYVTAYTAGLENKVRDLVEAYEIKETGAAGRQRLYDVMKAQPGWTSIIKFFDYDKEMKDADEAFSRYLKDHILNSSVAQCMDGKAAYIIRKLMTAYMLNPQQLPDNIIISIVDDWYAASQKERESGPYMTLASSARDTLQKILSSNDSDINALLLRRICDFIAGMTDQYAMDSFDRLYGTKGYEYRESL